MRAQCRLFSDDHYQFSAFPFPLSASVFRFSFPFPFSVSSVSTCPSYIDGALCIHNPSSQLNSKQSTLSSQINKSNDDIVAVVTQLAMICNSASQKLFQLILKLMIIYSLQNTDMEPQSNCGLGLWYQLSDSIISTCMSDPLQQCPVWREWWNKGLWKTNYLD